MQADGYFPYQGGCLHRQVVPAYLYSAEVEHRPAKLSAGGVGNDFVGYDVVIAITRDFKCVEEGLLPALPVADASIVLDRKLWFEVFVADVGIIEVVERGHAESPLAEGPQLQVVPGKGSVVDKECGGVFVAMGRGVVEPCLFLNECAQQASLYVEPFPLE